MFDIADLIKTIRKKFVVLTFSFNKFEDITDVPEGIISLINDLQEKDDKFGVSLKKAPKFTYSVIHWGSNKKNVNLTLAMFHKTAKIAITFLQLFFRQTWCS